MRRVSAPTPIEEPARIVAGDTAKWLKTLGDYPASAGWVLTYTLVNAANRYNVTCSASGDDHLASVPATTTTDWAPGDYALRGQVAKSGEVYTVFEGRATVAPSYDAAVDSRSQARRQLDAIEAVVEGRAADSVAEYSIGGRAIKRIPLPELLQLRDRLRFDVQREEAAARAAAGLPSRGRVMVRFGGW